MTKIIAPTKKFISDHKVAIAVIATTTVCVALHRVAIKDQMTFLKERGLLEEFLLPEA